MKVRAALSDELSEGEFKRIDAGSRAVLLARVEGAFYAIDAVCSHRRGNLADGHLEGCRVICPLHSAAFDLRDGRASPDTPWGKDLECFAVTEEDGVLFVNIDTAQGVESTAASRTAVGASDVFPRAGFRYDPLDEDQRENPFPLYAKARRETPVFYDDRLRIWVVLRYEDAWTVLKDPARFSSRQSTQLPDTAKLAPEVVAVLRQGYPEPPTMITNDPPLHTRFRGLVNKAFTSRMVAHKEPRVKELANELVDSFIAQGQVDLVRRFAYPLPMTVIAEILGVPDEDLDMFKRWSDDVMARLATDLPLARQIECAHSLVEMRNYFAKRLEERRHQPRDDMLTGLLDARLEGEEPLTLPEMLAMVQQLLVAGNETTTNLIASMVYQLCANPDQLEEVRRDPSLAAAVVEETLRMESPLQGFFRTATEDVELSGVRIPKGAQIQVHYGAANRDPSEFPEPDRFDLHRRNASTHLAFGGGVHFCLGAPLARLEARLALNVLLERLPELRLVAGQKLQHHRHFYLRGFEHLWVQWQTRGSDR